MDDVHKVGAVQATEYTETGVKVTALVPPSLAGKLLPYSLKPAPAAARAAAEPGRAARRATASADGWDVSSAEASSEEEDGWVQ